PLTPTARPPPSRRGSARTPALCPYTTRCRSAARGDVEAHPAARSGAGDDRHAGLPQPLDVPLDRPRGHAQVACQRGDRPPPPSRSEEHTSELQSREKLVCRLLLEEKRLNAGS